MHVVKMVVKKIKFITASIGFCTLLTSATVKVLFKLMQQVILKEYSSHLTYHLFVMVIIWFV